MKINNSFVFAIVASLVLAACGDLEVPARRRPLPPPEATGAVPAVDTMVYMPVPLDAVEEMVVLPPQLAVEPTQVAGLLPGDIVLNLTWEGNALYRRTESGDMEVENLHIPPEVDRLVFGFMCWAGRRAHSTAFYAHVSVTEEEMMRFSASINLTEMGWDHVDTCVVGVYGDCGADARCWSAINDAGNGQYDIAGTLSVADRAGHEVDLEPEIYDSPSQEPYLTWAVYKHRPDID